MRKFEARVRLKLLMTPLAVFCVTAAVAAQCQQHFFPQRPHSVTTHVVTGVLVAYAMGNDSGGFTIARGSETIEFSVGYPLTLAGTLYPRCLPAPSRIRDDREGKRWPRSLFVGKSRVRVTYWWQNEPGVGLVRASDNMALDP